MAGEPAIEGRVEPGWELVREVFRDNFVQRGEIGAALTVLHRGQPVVALHGGTADVTTGRPWTAQTPAVCFSVTKGLVAACFLLLEDRGEIDLDAPITAYWPELTVPGLTPRVLLNHRAGLAGIDVPLALTDVRDRPEAVHEALVRQAPLWPPGTDQGYHACSYGLYTAELFRRVAGRSVGAFFADELAAPLRLDATIGRPEALPEPPARLVPNGLGTLLRHQLPAAFFSRSSDGAFLRRVLAGRRADAHRALLNPTLGRQRFHALDEPEIQRLELPWMNGIATATALARLYAPLAGDGSLDGVRVVRPEALAPLRERQSWSDCDRVLRKPVGWSQGFVKDLPGLFSADTAGFGHPGAGGSLGWADPTHELSIGYTMNRMDWRIRSPRAVALCQAVQRVVA
ncbi:MAG: serine hydrolase domain-containing protein [Myxococcota bacterium]